MSTSSNAADRSLLRKSLLQVASLLLLTLLSLALLALFSVWSLQRAYQRNEREVTQLFTALDASRQAQVEFKRQVQEWKNLLLRGEEPTTRVRYFNAFTNAEQTVDNALASVDQVLGENSRYSARLTELRRRHALLGEQYRAALTAASGGRWAPFASDLAVRGIDRPLDQDIDRLAADFLRDFRERNATLNQSIEQRYQALQTALWTAMVASLLLVGLLLWRVLAQRPATA